MRVKDIRTRDEVVKIKDLLGTLYSLDGSHIHRSMGGTYTLYISSKVRGKQRKQSVVKKEENILEQYSMEDLGYI